MEDLRLLNMEEAMKILGGIGRTTMYKLVRTKEIPVKKIGKRTMFTREAISNYIDKLGGYEGEKNGF